MEEVKLSLLEDDCNNMMEKLVDYEVSPNESQERATQFFRLAYRVNSKLRDVENEIIKANVLTTASYANAFGKIDEKINVSKGKAIALADKTYMSQDIKLKRLDAQKTYWKNMFELMTNGMIFYKGLIKG